jgi:amphi-Trp domain-containing protein
MSGAHDREYEFELTAGRDEVAAVLSSVVEGLSVGSVRVSDGKEAVAVDVPDSLELEVEVELEDGEVSLELELTWPARDEGSTVRHEAEPADGRAGVSVSPPAAETGTSAGAETDDDEAATDGSLARFELFRDRSEEWRWRLRHRNGNVIATSGEGYTRKHNALKGLRSVARNAPNAGVTEESSR